jgi:hypothetical protein
LESKTSTGLKARQYIGICELQPVCAEPADNRPMSLVESHAWWTYITFR